MMRTSVAAAATVVISAAAFAPVVGSATAVGPTTATTGAPPVVVVTTNILGDITANVAGDLAEVVTLMPPGADPHSFGVSAAEAATMVDADLLIANGLGLEEGVLATVEAAAAEGVPLLEIGPAVDPIPFGDAAGDDEGQLDPHIWTDPDRMITASRLIEERLADVVAAADREKLAANTDAYTGELEQLAADIETRVDDVPSERRRLVTNHNVFGYFAARFGFEVIGTVLPSGTTLASPSAADLADLAATIDDAGVPAIFADSSQPDRLAQVLADEADAHIVVVSLYSESLGPEGSGADTYIGMMRTNTDLIVTALTADEH